VTLTQPTLLLTCIFSENIDIVWTRRDGQLPTDGRVEKLNYNTELFIKNVQKSDEATYVCTGNGAGGSTDFPISFIVQGKSAYQA
jgi:hypothetical protein